MNLPRTSRKKRQLSIEASPYQQIKESDHKTQGSSHSNTVFSTKRTSVANASSTSTKGSNQILFSSPNNDDNEISKQQLYHGPYHQQLSHRNSNLKVPPFQGLKSDIIHSIGTGNLAPKSKTHTHNNLPTNSLLTPRNTLPFVAPFLRKINEVQKSPYSHEKLKTDRSSAGDILATERSSQSGRSVEYFALVDSICRNHALLLHSAPNIEDSSQNLSTNERSNITEIFTKQVSKDTSRIYLNQLTKGQKFRQSLRSLKDLSDDYIKTKLKIIQDRKWLAKNKKIYTEGNIEQNSEIDHPFQQLSQNVSLKLLPKEDEAYFKYPKQQDKDDFQRPLFGSKKLSSFYFGEVQKVSTPISQNFQSPSSPSPQKLKLISPRGEIGREIYPFKKVESFFQGSSRNSEQTLQNEIISQKQVNTPLQDVSINDKIENIISPNNRAENALKKAQSEWQSQHNIIESQTSTPKKFTIQSSTRLIHSRASHKNIKNPDLSANKEELEIAMILEKKITNPNSKNDIDQGISRSESKKQTNMERIRKKQREQDTQQIEQLEVALLSRGLIQAEEKEDDLLATRLRIHNYFRQKQLSLSEKQEAFSRLFKQFDGENNSPSQKKANQIISILRNMKPFYLQQQQGLNDSNFSKKPKSVYDLLVSIKKQN